MRCPKHLRDRSNKRQSYSDCFSTILQPPAFSDGLNISSNDCVPRRGTFANTCPSASHYVPNIPMFRLSLRNHVYKLPIIMHFKAFIHIRILNSHVNFNQNQSCQLQISSANNECLLSCQFQRLTVSSTFLLNSSSCSYVNQIQFLFKCNSFLLSVKRQVRTQEQLVPILLISAE